MSKLRSVIRHEYMTIVRQPSFWLAMIAIPLLIGVIIGLNIISSKTTQDRVEELAKDIQTVAIIDNSGLINKNVVQQGGLTLADNSQLGALQEKVRTGESQGLVVFPKNLSEAGSYRIYLDGSDIAVFSAVQVMSENLLKTSLFLPLGEPEIIALAQNGASSEITFYRDGKETAGFNEYIVPALFVILFYIVFAFSVSYMLTSVSEEKENRSMEMVLTYVNPRTLIVGKLLAVSLVTLTQIAFFAILAVSAFIIALNMNDGITLPFGIDLAKAVFDPATIVLGFGYLIAGFLMYAGFMTTVAAMAPSSKEANNFSAVFIVAGIIPFYFISTIVTDPTNPIITFITYFPLTSPITALVRNTVGNMDPFTAWSALAVMIIFMILSIWLAVRAFRLGALEFAQAMKLSTILKS